MPSSESRLRPRGPAIAPTSRPTTASFTASMRSYTRAGRSRPAVKLRSKHQLNVGLMQPAQKPMLRLLRRLFEQMYRRTAHSTSTQSVCPAASSRVECRVNLADAKWNIKTWRVSGEKNFHDATFDLLYDITEHF